MLYAAGSLEVSGSCHLIKTENVHCIQVVVSHFSRSSAVTNYRQLIETSGKNMLLRFSLLPVAFLFITQQLHEQTAAFQFWCLFEASGTLCCCERMSLIITANQANYVHTVSVCLMSLIHIC